jgi:hypothetical protein
MSLILFSLWSSPCSKSGRRCLTCLGSATRTNSAWSSLRSTVTQTKREGETESQSLFVCRSSGRQPLIYLVSVMLMSSPSPFHLSSMSQTRREGGIHRVHILLFKGNLISLVFQNFDPHPPLRPASLSSPRKGGGYTLTGRRGGWGVNILEDERHRIALFQ